MNYLIFIILFLFPFEALFAQPDSNEQNIKGYWCEPGTEATTFAWQAQWIWLDEEITSDVMLARRSIELLQVPEKVQLRITASSQYQLYINGKYICRGPARSAPHHQSFDILNVRDLMQVGENVIAVRVHHQKGKRSYHLSGRAGFLAQMDITSNGKKSSIITNNAWRVSPDLSWDNTAPRISRFQLVVNDRIDLRNKIKGWNEVSFDDTNWAKAVPLKRNMGWPAPQRNDHAHALTPPWTSLIPRDIPYVKEPEEKAIHLIEVRTIKSDTIVLTGLIDADIVKEIPAYIEGNGPLIIHGAGNHVNQFLLFDLGQVLNGTAQLDLVGAAGTVVEIMSAPFLINNTFTSNVVDSDFRDQIVLSGEKDRWEATYFKPTRYLGIVIRNASTPIKLYSVSIRHLVYPFNQEKFIFSKDAAWVEQYMKASAKTIQVCTTDGYTDNYRERRQYAQTGYYAALGNYWLFGDYALQRRYLVQVAQEQEANGMMPAYAPLSSDDYMIILDSNCLWIRSLRNYFLYSGDSRTVRELLPAARKLLTLLHSYTHSLGFLNNPPYPYWLDHTQNDRRGANFCLNGHYLGALEDFAQVLDWLSETGKEEYKSRAELLRQSLRTHLWDENHQLFADAWIDGARSDQFSEHANGMALAMKVASDEQADFIARKILASDSHNYIKRANGMTMVTPAMSYFLHKGLCDYGYVDESFQMFRQRFDQMLAPDFNGTLWEEWWLDGTGRGGKFQGGRTRSDAQTESAFPPALFAEYLLGINPVKPGLKEIEISRPQTSIHQIEAIIPSPQGDLHVNWNLGQKPGGELMLEIPGNMQVRLNLKSLIDTSNQSIFIDSQEIELKEQDKPYFTLARGHHHVNF